MSAAPPPVSVGLPVYNGERYLEGCLESLLGQTYADFELVVSDNASTDATEEICRAAARRDDRVRYERLPENLGAVGNFNRVAERAVGRYFKWAAYDDLCAPAFLERCVEALEADPDAVWCHPLTRHLAPDGAVVPAAADPALRPGADSHSLLRPATAAAGGPAGGGGYDRASPRAWQRFRAVVLGTTWCSDAYGLIRTDALRTTRLYLSCFGAEKLLMAELALRGRFAEVPEVLFFQRVHAGAASNLHTRAAEAAFARAGAAGTFSTARLTLLRGYLSMVAAADLSPVDRARCLATLGLYVGQVGKWKRVAQGMLTGRGLGDDTYETIAANLADTAPADPKPAEAVPADAKPDATADAAAAGDGDGRTGDGDPVRVRAAGAA